MPSVHVICEKCEKTERIRPGHWNTHCENESCNANLLLAPVANGKRYISVNCKESRIDFVDADDLIVKCTCCTEKAVEFAVDSMIVEIRNGQKIFATTEATAFIKRRCKEMLETRKKLETAVVGLGEFGARLPEMKPKTAESYGNVDLLAMSHYHSFTAVCDTCGVKSKIPPGCFGSVCQNTSCTGHKTILRTLPETLKYIHIKCETSGKSYCGPRLSTASFVTCDCCEKEYAVDTVVSIVINNQPIYSMVPSTGFIKRQNMELAQMKDQLKIAQRELDKMTKKRNKKPSLWKRMCIRIRNFFTFTKKKNALLNNNNNNDMKLYLL